VEPIGDFDKLVVEKVKELGASNKDALFQSTGQPKKGGKRVKKSKD
jgi:hypothetical protein